MALIVPNRRIWTRQPSVATGVDHHNSSANGLVLLWNGAVPYLNQANERSVTPTFVNRAAFRYGSSPDFVAASAHGVDCGALPEFGITSQITIGVIFRLTTAPASGSGYSLVARDKDTGGRAYTFDVFNDPTPSNGGVRFYVNGGGLIGTNMVVEGAAPAAGHVKFAVATYYPSASRLRLYINGNLVSSWGVSTAIPTATDSLRIARRGYSGFEDYLNGQIALAFVANREWTESEVRNAWINPWQLFAPLSSPIFYSLPAAGGAYTLFADTGAFTLTGQDAALSVARLIGADTGTFTLTGQDAALTAARTIGADTGQFTLTGQDAELTYTPTGGAPYTMPASTGTFSLSGLDASLTAQRLLSGDTGAITLTGLDADLARTRALDAETGAFSLSGLDADLSTTGTVTPASSGQQPAGKSKRRRRRIELRGRMYEVDERDIPALLEAVLRDSKPPGTAEVVEPSKPAPKAPQKARKAAPAVSAPQPEPVSVDLVAERIAMLQAEIQRQAEQDVLRMLDRVAQRVMAEVEDEDDALVALLLA